MQEFFALGRKRVQYKHYILMYILRSKVGRLNLISDIEVVMIIL